MTEINHAQRIDGSQAAGIVIKVSYIPTAIAAPLARPQFRLIYSIARYNQFAADNLYLPYLFEIGPKKWGQYIGVRVEWWLF